MKTYELTLSNNYVTNWGLEEAIRELLQNAIDSQEDGNKMYVNYNNGNLSIINDGCNLDIGSLVLGNTSKDNNSIGQFGEGYKLALIVLLRLGKNVTIYTNKEIWKPYFKMSSSFNTETLHIDIEEDIKSSNLNDKIEFCISGITYEELVKLREHHIIMLECMGHSVGQYEESEYGRILVDNKYSGMMFVEGLFIQKDNNFKFGYDFNKEYVDLDRDRKAINFYELKELTAKALAAQQSISLLNKALSIQTKDTSELKYAINEMTQSFKEEFAYDFLDRHKLSEDTFIGTKKEIEYYGKDNVFVTSKIEAEIINQGLGKEEEYKKITDRVANSNKIEDAWVRYRTKYSNISSTKDKMEWLSKIQKKINIEEYNTIMKIFLHDAGSLFENIKDEVFSNLGLIEKKVRGIRKK